MYIMLSNAHVLPPAALARTLEPEDICRRGLYTNLAEHGLTVTRASETITPATLGPLDAGDLVVGFAHTILDADPKWGAYLDALQEPGGRPDPPRGRRADQVARQPQPGDHRRQVTVRYGLPGTHCDRID